MNKLQAITQAVKGGWDNVFLRNLDLLTDDNVKKEPYKKSTIVYSCISTTGRAISQAPLVVLERKGDTWEQVPEDHPWQQLVARPNYLMDVYTFVEALIGHLMLDGNVFTIGFPPGLSMPDSLWVVPRRNMTKRTDKASGQLIGWRYSPAGDGSNTISLDIDEVAHIKFWNPYDPIMGMAPLEAGGMPLSSDYKAAVYNENFFDEGAVPGGMLTTEQKLGQKQFTRAKEQFQARHTGYRKSHRMAVLEQGLKYTQAGITHKDMEFLSLRKFNREELYQIYGMKKIIMSVTDDLNFATAKQERKEWWQGTNIPMMKLALSALNFTLFRQTPGLKLGFDLSSVEALHEEYNDKVKTGKQLFHMGVPFNQVNERLELGFDELPWGNTGFISGTLVPLGLDGLPIVPEVPVAETVTETVMDVKQIEYKWQTEAKANWDALMHRVQPIEDKFESKTRRVFFNMRKRALSLLFQKTVQNLAEELFAEEAELLAKQTEGIYVDAMEAGVTSLAVEVGITLDLDLYDPDVSTFLSGKTMQIKGVVGTVAKQVRQKLVWGAETGAPINDIAKEIRGVFNTSMTRARAIARTEVIGATNYARHYQMARTSFTHKRWVTAGDTLVRASHKTMGASEPIRMGELWVLPDGSTLRYPGDWMGPAKQIVRCRCIEVIVID